MSHSRRIAFTFAEKRSVGSGGNTHFASKPPVKKVKIKGVSSIVKKLIEELSSETSQDFRGYGRGNFDLYNTIINMEGQEEIAKRDLIKSYYNFGKALEDRYDHYKKNNPKRTAQALVNKEVRKQLPDSVLLANVQEKLFFSSSILAIIFEIATMYFFYANSEFLSLYCKMYIIVDFLDNL